MINMRWLVIPLFCLFATNIWAVELNDQLRECIEISIPKAEKVNGDLSHFIALTKPMAPLDLNIRNQLSEAAASSEKNFFYGAMAAVAGLDQNETQQITDNFFARYQGIKPLENASLLAVDVSCLARRISTEMDISVISTWDSNAFRINDAVVTNGTLIMFQCKEFPYFPCPSSETTATAMAPEKITSLITRAKPLINEMRRLGLVAVVKQQIGIRAILDGVSDNEVGFFMPTSNKFHPTVFPDGKKIVFSHLVAPSVFFYATN